jgi:hypothetical protein
MTTLFVYALFAIGAKKTVTQEDLVLVQRRLAFSISRPACGSTSSRFVDVRER